MDAPQQSLLHRQLQLGGLKLILQNSNAALGGLGLNTRLYLSAFLAAPRAPEFVDDELQSQLLQVPNGALKAGSLS